MNKPNVPEHLCGLNEIASAFRVSVSTVREWIEDGMPCLMLGGKWQARYCEVWEWLKERNEGRP